MGDDHITFRAGSGLKERLDDLAEKYGMKRSQLLRLMLQDSVGTVERDGLDAVADGDETGESCAEA